MSEYYAVQRSDKYLAHYGVKGMKWGVRKAITDGNEHRLERHYRRAAKKLAKLNAKADVKQQKARQLKYAKRAGIGLGIGAAGTAGIFGGNIVSKALSNKIKGAFSDKGKAFLDSQLSAGNNVRIHVSKNNPLYNDIEKFNGSQDLIRKAKGAAGLAAIGGNIYGGYAGARSLAAANRTTDKGHAKAVAKRNAWKKEMQSAFKGTKYQNLPEVKKPVNTKKLNRQLKRANNWADAYRDSIAELKRQNDHTDIYKKRNDKYIAKWNKKLNKHESRARNIRKQLGT